MEDFITEKYKKIMFLMTRIMLPNVPFNDMSNAMDQSIRKREKLTQVDICNNYTNKTIPERETKTDKNGIQYEVRAYDFNIKDMTNYILAKNPIMTAWGVLFKKHDVVPNPLTDMIKDFMDLRGIHKSEMFKYPKGSEEYAKWNLMQLLDKIDGNGIYGVLAQASSIFYNINVAASITAQGRSLISSVTMFFEMFLSNNVKFASLDEIITFVHNVINEKLDRHYNDYDILDSNISYEDCFAKLIYTCGDFRRGKVKWIPNEEELDIIWNLLNGLSQEDINRIYYKNNLFEFVNNKSVTKAIIYILSKLETPYMDPNKVPDEVKVELEVLTDMIKEYVYYKYQIIDRIDRCNNMVKNVCVISDTDSAIVCFDGWYRFILEKVKGIKFRITQIRMDEVSYLENEKSDIEEVETELDYDFYNDEITEVKKAIHLMKIIPQDGLRYSIINIISYICGVLVNDYMVEYTKQNNSYSEGKKCLIISKNEFLIKRALLTNNKKNYASKLELQEGNIVPDTMDASLDIKGLPINKSTVNANVRKELKKILYEDIINSGTIDQLKVIKHLRILEKQIFESLQSGSKDYYKPVSIKSMSNYDDPMRIQGIKASYIWNIVRDEDLEAIDLDSRNTIDIIKVEINERNVWKIKDKYPETYEKLLSVLRDQYIQKFGPHGEGGTTTAIGDGEITSLAIPVNVNTPEWVMEFIDYTSIINDCLCNFPIESIGIDKMSKQTINYTNIVSL